MKAQSNTPFSGVHTNKSEANVLPLSGQNFSEDAIRDTGLSPEEVELLEQEKQLEAKRVQLQQKKDAAKAEAEQQLMDALGKAKTAAANFRAEARTCSDPDEKKSLYEWAREADQETRRIEAELGLSFSVLVDESEEVDHKTFFQRNRWAAACLQVFGVMLAIWFFHAKFNGARDEMQQLNKGLAVENQLQPYDQTSIQKLFYEKLVVFSDLPLALLILLLIVPFVGFYVLPFLKSRKDFYTEFYEDLTAWQRTKIATAFCLGFLFFLALSHMVKP